jgi:hypothetical protein
MKTKVQWNVTVTAEDATVKTLKFDNRHRAKSYAGYQFAKGGARRVEVKSAKGRTALRLDVNVPEEKWVRNKK